MELERVLTKLKFDQDVRGYALLTNDGQPFLSFGLPDEILPQIKGTLSIHASSLRLMNILTSQGTVVLARADKNWVLAVLFVPDLNLGFALQRTKDVTVLMEKVQLPPPPKPVVEQSLPVAESEVVSETESAPVADVTSTVARPQIELRHGCIILRGIRYAEATRIDSQLYDDLKHQFSNLGLDILMMVDEKRTAFKIAEVLAKNIDKVLEVLQWCYGHELIDAECPEEQEPGTKEILEMPLFDGDLNKAKKEHRLVLALCDGTKTVHDIADELGILYFAALQAIVPYRGKSLKMVRRTRE